MHLHVMNNLHILFNCACFFILRTILAAIHFNYNLTRDNKVNDNGEAKLKLVYPKFKDGDATVREVKVTSDYGKYTLLMQIWN